MTTSASTQALRALSTSTAGFRYPLRAPTPSQDALVDTWTQPHADALAAAEGNTVAVQVLLLHAPQRGAYGAECTGCDGDDEWGLSDWPCPTAQLVCKHYKEETS